MLVPELTLLVGAFVVLFAGLSRGSVGRGLVSPITLIVVVVALAASFGLRSVEGAGAPGLWVSALTTYVRCIALGVGGLLVLANWHQPVSAERGEYMAMVLFSLLGVLLTASANDLVVLFFSIELVSVPTYVLVALSRKDRRASEASLKYFFLGAMSAAILAYGLSFLYGAAGTTAMMRNVAGGSAPVLVGGAEGYRLIGLSLVLVGLAYKVAAVPFHAYAPDVYEGAASPVTGLLGFVPKLAGFVGLIRVFTACGWDVPVPLMWGMWLMAAATMTFGNVVALLQQNVKRMLAYSSIAHTGYMLIALLVGPVAGAGPLKDGVAALLFYMGVYGAMNLGAFAVLAVFSTRGRELEDMASLSGLAGRSPWGALALAVCVFSLMGFPPTAGFIGKLYIFSSAFSLDGSHAFRGPLIALAVIGVMNSAIAAAYYLRIVGAMYMQPAVGRATASRNVPLRWAVAVCAAGMLVLFVRPTALSRPARNATVALQGAVGSVGRRVAATRDGSAPVAAGVAPTLVGP